MLWSIPAEVQVKLVVLSAEPGCICVAGERDSAAWPKYFDNDFSVVAVLLRAGAVGSSVEQQA